MQILNITILKSKTRFDTFFIMLSITKHYIMTYESKRVYDLQAIIFTFTWLNDFDFNCMEYLHIFNNINR